jgi:F0F1-type ATP synthase delta subunit
MKQIEHSLKFITELDENDPTAKRLLSLPKQNQIAMLEGMLKQIIAPKLKPILDEVNANNSFALLRVVE